MWVAGVIGADVAPRQSKSMMAKCLESKLKQLEAEKKTSSTTSSASSNQVEESTSSTSSIQ
eukprot:2268221-Prorocentrum_lima.AAC.1